MAEAGRGRSKLQEWELGINADGGKRSLFLCAYRISGPATGQQKEMSRRSERSQVKTHDPEGGDSRRPLWATAGGAWSETPGPY